MKKLLAICMFVAATFAWAGENMAPPSSGTVKGEVLEVKDVENFTYLLLKMDGVETWAAVMKTPVSKGAMVTIENAIVMKNFQSKTLKKTFPSIIFGNLSGAAGASASAATANAQAGHVMGATTPLMPKKLPTINSAADDHVTKATGSNAKTVAEVAASGSKLKDKTVVVRGKVVKYNPEIMGKNWIHLRDGSGSAADETNDILVTTNAKAKVGDVVTVKGVVHTDKDFGAGYAYKVLIEEATLQ